MLSVLDILYIQIKINYVQVLYQFLLLHSKLYKRIKNVLRYSQWDISMNIKTNRSSYSNV